MARKKRKRPPGEKKLLDVFVRAGRPLLLGEVLDLLQRDHGVHWSCSSLRKVLGADDGVSVHHCA